MLDPLNAVDDLAPIDLELDEDLQAALDQAPSRVQPVARPRYRPGTRQEHATPRGASSTESWWTRPDADFGKEAERMRVQHAKLKVPGEHNVIGWKAAL